MKRHRAKVEHQVDNFYKLTMTGAIRYEARKTQNKLSEVQYQRQIETKELAFLRQENQMLTKHLRRYMQYCANFEQIWDHSYYSVSNAQRKRKALEKSESKKKHMLLA